MQLHSQMNHVLVVLCELCVSKGIQPDGKGVCARVCWRGVTPSFQMFKFLQELQNCKAHFNNA